MTEAAPKPAKTPCPSCPYRRDVPSGIWAAHEYAKLPAYDGETIEQLYAGATSLFYCHQQNGCLCSGWVGCHDTRHLLALRLSPVDPSTFDYESPVPLFASGAEAAAHGMRDIDEPADEAHAAMAKLERMQKRKKAKEGQGTRFTVSTPHSAGETDRASVGPCARRGEGI